MKRIFFLGVILSHITLALLLSSCGPSAEERQQQEIRDSIKLEEDRRKLIDRANEMFSPEEIEKEQKAIESEQGNLE